ncbi:hypothetical protein CEXT_208601 [Caerostris extrusa]|uniref:Uncharacterized protein n=1 Tax=Caerostris extrusa TaxID=172846 RepID=A0AAV4XHY8_CAEEX|nr:hypothetical protein CEXT_208601 [Caerostris extrusa]
MKRSLKFEPMTRLPQRRAKRNPDEPVSLLCVPALTKDECSSFHRKEDFFVYVCEREMPIISRKLISTSPLSTLSKLKARRRSISNETN